MTALYAYMWRRYRISQQLHRIKTYYTVREA